MPPKPTSDVVVQSLCTWRVSPKVADTSSGNVETFSIMAALLDLIIPTKLSVKGKFGPSCPDPTT